MGLVKEEDHLWFIKVANFWRAGKECVKQPEQERSVKVWTLEEFDGMETVDNTATIGVDSEEVFNVEGWFAEELIGALLFEGEQAALNDANTLRSDVTILERVFVLIFCDILERGAKIGEINKLEAFVFGNLEHDIQVALLSF